MTQKYTCKPSSVVVISLRSQVRRRAFQSAQLERLGLDFTFVDAMHPDDIDKDEMARRQSGWARPLRPTEVACLLSHRRVWADTACASGPVLILEDDAVLSGDLRQALVAIEQLENVDLVNLETFLQPKLLDRDISSLGFGNYHLARLYRDRGGAAAYVLWPRAAHKLLALTETRSPLADAAINIAPGIHRFQVLPALAIQAMFLPHSNFPLEESVASSGRRPPYPSVSHWLSGRVYRLKLSLRLALIRISTMFRAKAISVPFAKSDLDIGNHNDEELT